MDFWYRVLHLVGLIPQYKLSDLPALTTAPVFDATWQNFVTWGRLQSFVIGCVYVCLVTVLIRRLIRMWQIAVLAGVALAFSDGIALAYRIMRSELLSSALVFLALLLTLIAAREGPNGRRFLNLGLAALLVSLSLTEKVQALLPALTIPMIALAFGKDERDASASAVSQGAWLRAVILCSLGLVLVVPTIGLVEDGLTGMASSHLFQYRPLFANWPGLYQWLLVAYVAFGMVLYASIWRVRPLDTALGLMAVLVGLALGLLALYGRYDLNVVIPVVNPVEHLHAVSGSPGANLPTTSIAMLASQFLTGLGKALAVHTFFLSPSHRPTLLIEWLAIYAALLIWRRGEKQVALQIRGDSRGGICSGRQLYLAHDEDLLRAIHGPLYCFGWSDCTDTVLQRADGAESAKGHTGLRACLCDLGERRVVSRNVRRTQQGQGLWGRCTVRQARQYS